MHAKRISLPYRKFLAEWINMQVSKNVLWTGLHAKHFEEDKLGCR